MVPVLVVALLSGGGGGASVPPGPPASDSVCVVAHAGRARRDADAELVRRIFLMRQRFWPDGSPAHPVNLPATSPVRERFSLAVLGESVRALAPYWDDRYFHGTRPPLSVGSQDALVLFVSRTAGSVGYVDGPRAADLPHGVVTLFCAAAPPSTSSEAGGGAEPAR